MSPSNKRYWSPESSDPDDSTSNKRKRKPQSMTGHVHGNEDESLPRPRPPPSIDELDRISYHIELQEFASNLQNAADTIFPGHQISRYSRVDVILLSWEDEDPRLPVSIEIKELAKILADIYNYNVEEWLIPEDDSHNKLQTKVLQFLDNSNPRHLKIVYYAGHGKLTNHGQPAWTSRRNSGQERCPTVKWSGIQNSLEESRSDVLILLDCCASGVCTTDEGNGVTELMAACAYNSIANGVGPFSFTHALNMKLRQLAHLPSFTFGYLYNTIFTEVQSWRFEDSRHKKAPIHLVLSQNHDHPRSIRLSSRSKGKGAAMHASPTITLQRNAFPGTEPHSAGPQDPSSTHTSSTSSSAPDNNGELDQDSSPSSSTTSLSQLPEYPKLLFSIRISEDVKPRELSTELFTDWLREVPMLSSLVKVEAAFASDSTLLLVSMPAAMYAYLPSDPSITLLGTTRSVNLLPTSVPDVPEATNFESARATFKAQPSKDLPSDVPGSSMAYLENDSASSRTSSQGQRDSGSESDSIESDSRPASPPVMNGYTSQTFGSPPEDRGNQMNPDSRGMSSPLPPSDEAPSSPAAFAENLSLPTPLPSLTHLSTLAEESEKDTALEPVPRRLHTMRSSPASHYTSKKATADGSSKERLSFDITPEWISN